MVEESKPKRSNGTLKAAALLLLGLGGGAGGGILSLGPRVEALEELAHHRGLLVIEFKETLVEIAGIKSDLADVKGWQKTWPREGKLDLDDVQNGQIQALALKLTRVEQDLRDLRASNSP